MVDIPSIYDDMDLPKLVQCEKQERCKRSTLKCLEVCIKILNFHLLKDNYADVLKQIVALSKKKHQSGVVVIGMLKFSVKKLVPKIENITELKVKYLETLAHIVHLMRCVNGQHDSQFEEMKMNLLKSIESRNLDDIQYLILNMDYDPDNITVERVKKYPNIQKVLLGSASDFKTETSTKINIENKLEISLKETLPSTRGLKLQSKLLSPNEASTKETQCLQHISSLKSDMITFPSRMNTTTKESLPYISLAVDVTLSATQMKKILINELTRHGMILMGNEADNVLTLEKRETNVIKNLCQWMFSASRTVESNVIQCRILYSENKYERIIEIKAISGRFEILENVIILFIKSFSSHVKKMKINKKSEKFLINAEAILKDCMNNEKIKQLQRENLIGTVGYATLLEEENSIIDSSNKEASNYYQIYKIISQENYDLGKSVSKFLVEFKEKHRKVEESSKYIPKQMEEVMNMIEECVCTFHHYFNFGKSNTEKLLPFCRPAVEKFIFNKISYLIYDIYNKKYERDNVSFLQNQSIIKVKMSVDEIMDYLEIKKEFREEKKVVADLLGISAFNVIPYKSTIDCINKTEYEPCPSDKLDTLMKASLEMRNSILGMTGGKAELNSMDDELPLFIYITTQINVKNIIAELRIIEDYLRMSKSVDKESKVLTNLMSAVFYISNSWRVEQKEKEKEEFGIGNGNS